jgi:hypothetical protein
VQNCELLKKNRIIVVAENDSLDKKSVIIFLICGKKAKNEVRNLQHT